jgi:hypothetical protein
MLSEAKHLSLGSEILRFTQTDILTAVRAVRSFWCEVTLQLLATRLHAVIQQNKPTK